MARVVVVVVLLLFLHFLETTASIPILTNEYKCEFVMFESSMGRGVMKGVMFYSWRYKAQKFIFSYQNWNETNLFDSSHGETGNFSSQYSYKTGPSSSCGCEVGGLLYSQPRLFLSNDTKWIIGKSLDGCVEYKPDLSTSPLVSVWVDSEGFICHAVFTENNRTFLFTNFDQLNFVASEFKIPDDCLCRAPLDIALVLDRSASISRQEFQDEKQFTSQFAKQFQYLDASTPLSNVAQTTQITIINFNTISWTSLSLANGSTSQNINSSIDAMSCCTTLNTVCCEGSTSISTGVREAANSLSTSTRVWSKKVMVIVTDGFHNTPYRSSPSQPQIDCYSECREFNDATFEFYECILQLNASRLSCLQDLQKGVDYAHTVVPDLSILSVGVGALFLQVRPTEFSILTDNNPNFQLSVAQWSQSQSIIQELVYLVCQTNQNPCGTCCGFCACSSCRTPDFCVPSDGCHEARAVGSCCQEVPKQCPPPVDPCSVAICTNGTCSNVSLTCPLPNPCYNYECRNGNCVEQFLGIPVDPCHVATCNKSTPDPSTWSIQQNPLCSPRSNPCLLYTCVNGTCLTLPSPPPEDPPNACFLSVCNATTGLFSNVDVVCPYRPCMDVRCIPTTGTCEYTLRTCRNESDDLCELSTCNETTDMCDYARKQCNEPSSDNLCQLPTGLCYPSSGKCEYYLKECPPSKDCRDSVCNATTGNCTFIYSPRCSSDCLNVDCSKMNTNSCLTYSCLPTLPIPNCADAVDSSSNCNSSNTDPCLRYSECDPAHPGGCVYVPVECPTPPPCMTYLRNSTYPGCCQLRPSTTCGGGSNSNRCLNYTCNVTTGTCSSVPLCPPNDACTFWTCLSGKCIATHNNCSSAIGDQCLVSMGCIPARGGCLWTNLNCSDDDPCTDDACIDGRCVHTLKACGGVGSGGSIQQDNCTVSECDRATGMCVVLPKNCSDGDVCTVDSCRLGACVNERRMTTCDDHDVCTVDECHPVRGCVNTPIVCLSNDSCYNVTCNSNFGCIQTPIPCFIALPCSLSFCTHTNGTYFNSTANGTCTVVPLSCASPDQTTSIVAGTLLGLGGIIGVVIGAAVLLSGIGGGAVALFGSPVTLSAVQENPLYKPEGRPTNPIYSPKASDTVPPPSNNNN